MSKKTKDCEKSVEMKLSELSILYARWSGKEYDARDFCVQFGNYFKKETGFAWKHYIEGRKITAKFRDKIRSEMLKKEVSQ